MLYKGTAQITIEVPVWVEAESMKEARDKIENMEYEDLVHGLDLHNILDLFNIENPEEIMYQEL